jgi:hypothetical protein
MNGKAVCVYMAERTENRGLNLCGAQILLFNTVSGPAVGPTQPPTQCATWLSCLGVTPLIHETDQKAP